MAVFFRLLAAAVMLAATLAPWGGGTARAAVVRTQAYSMTTTTLNLRSGPGSGYPAIRSMPPGARVWVRSGPHGGAWYAVEYSGSAGYAHGAYLAPGRLRTVSTLGTTARVAALTFDAGADAGYAASILDTLRAERVRATFGVTGRWAEANPALLRRIVAEGHGLINHTHTHRSLTGYSTGAGALTYRERAEELWAAESAVRRLAGPTTKPYFRPPYGDHDASVLEDVWSRGYGLNVMWTVDSLGWRGLTREQIVRRCADGLRPGAIYLFHVGARSQDGPALPGIIRELRSRGYTFATIGDYYR